MYTVTYYQSEVIAYSQDFNTADAAMNYFARKCAGLKRGAIFLMDNIRRELMTMFDADVMCV